MTRTRGTHPRWLDPKIVDVKPFVEPFAWLGHNTLRVEQKHAYADFREYLKTHPMMDYSQVELRVLASMNLPVKTNVVEIGRDIHRAMEIAFRTAYGRQCPGCRSLDGEHDFGPTCTLEDKP